MKLLINGVLIAGVVVFGATSTVPVSASTDAINNSTSYQESYEEKITVPIETIVRGNEDEEKELDKMTVASGEYSVHVVAKNQRSVHPNNDIIVRSESDMVTVFDVEGVAFKEAEADGTLEVTDGEVKIYIKLGEDKVFSGGVEVVLTRIVPVPEPEPQPEPEEEPEVLAEVDEGKGEAEPEVLPETGAASLAGMFSGMSGLGYAAHRLIARRRK